MSAISLPNAASRASIARTAGQNWTSRVGYPPKTAVNIRGISRQLQTLGPAELLRACRAAASDCIDVVHLFAPKQCNMACVGCYASAVAIDKEPYRDGDAEAYFENAKDVILQAKQMGAHSVHTSGDGEITAFPKFFDCSTSLARRACNGWFSRQV